MKVGILGVGGMGNVHARQYAKMPDVEVAAFDLNQEKLAKYCEQWGVGAATSLESLIAQADVVDVCLPTDLHLPIGLQAIAAGKALFMEKPLASDVASCLQLIEAADKAQTPFMPGQVVRFFPEFRSARNLVVEGRIGTPAAARTRRGGKAPMGEGGWFKDFGRSGGILLDLAVHDFDWLRWTLGEVKHVCARSVAHNHPEMTVDYALTTLSFDSGAVAHIEATWMDPAGGRVTFEVCGSGGMIEYDSRIAHSLRTSIDGGSVVESPLSPTDDPYYQQLRSFIDSVKNGTPPLVSGADGLMAVSIACAAIESAKTGRLVAPARHI